MRKQFDTFPIDEIEAYTQIMQHITSKGDSKKTILRILSWVRNADRLLHVDELREIIWVEDKDTQLNTDDINDFGIDDIIRNCESLVTFDKETLQVKFSHTTVLEFLEKGVFAGDLISHASLAKTCLTYLNFEAFAAPCIDSTALDERRKEYTFAAYAAKYWAVHARNAKMEDVIWGDMLIAVVDTFQQDGKRESMKQLETRTYRFDMSTGKSLLHILVESKLATFYLPPLSENISNITYS